MRILTNIAISITEPRDTSLLWLRPIGSKYGIYLYDGGWKPISLTDDMGTATPYDDEIADVSNIPEIVKEVIPGVIGDSVEEEVRNQMEQIDFSKVNINSTPSEDESDYPDVDI